ncbi:MAG: methyltransferase domain-containing protein [Chloroflexaceae bacterium]|nr:methyltransferase domain-containing protein [Chloroflexaceae bacterium]
MTSMLPLPLFDQLHWCDPLSGLPLEPLISARTPAGVPVCGALRIAGTATGYPIVDCVARLTPELAQQHRAWLTPFDLTPPGDDASTPFQDQQSVASFGFQWTWNSSMRSEADLCWRVARRFQLEPAAFAGQLVLDAGAGAGDQSRWLLQQGSHVVSIDLSSAIDVVAQKLRMHPGWVGIQSDITVLPFASNQFDLVYCEGVIPFTHDSALTVQELCRMLRNGGLILATHYETGTRLHGHMRLALTLALRRHLSHLERYQLLFITGALATLVYLPVIGPVLRRSGLIPYSPVMPSFKTTWTNTFDLYGDHAYQRYISPDRFWRFFAQAGMIPRYRQGGVVAAQKP